MVNVVIEAVVTPPAAVGVGEVVDRREEVEETVADMAVGGGKGREVVVMAPLVGVEVPIEPAELVVFLGFDVVTPRKVSRVEVLREERLGR